ncbi:MAG: hypothetical protein HKL99_05490 [Burkholderiales bacterium]|jgi:hypothetical protein|nr:hypothetical protein [Burkholderiales bacterium]
MTNAAKITITAVDQATATMLKIRAQMRAMTQPMRDIKTSMGRFAEASGLKKVGQDLRKVGHAAGAVARGVTKTIAPMGALIGAGTIGGLAELANRWGQLGWSIERTAQTIGVAPQKLQALQGAAKLAGLSADDMTSSLGRLGTTLQDALYGRNQQALATLNYLGISIHKTATGAVDSARALSDLSRVMQKYNGQPQVQQKIAGEFGLESLLPLLRQGPEAMRKYEAEAKRLGYVLSGPELQRATLLGKSFTDLKMSLTGVRNSISDALFPVLQPLLVQMTNWVSANRQLIGTRVGEWVAEIAAWVRSVNWGAVWQSIKQTVAEIRNIAVGINSAVQSLGGWKTALELAFGAWAIGKLGMFTLAVMRVASAFGAVKTAATAAAVGDAGASSAAGGIVAGAATLGIGAGLLAYSPTIGQGAQRELNMRRQSLPARQQYVLSMLQKMGLTPIEASGLAANFTAESGLYARAVGDNGAAYGIGQWHAERQAQFAKLFGIPMQKSTLQQQLGFARWELGNTERGAQARAAKATTAQEAGSIYSRDYERPAHADREAATRGILAQQIYAQNQMMFRGAPPATAAQRVDVHVSMGNVPPGTKVTATDGNGHNVPVRVGRNLVGAS